MPKPNAYLLKKKAIESAKDQALIKVTINRDWDMWTIALNRTFGFGAKRINEARATVQKLYDEYVDAAGTDFVYADEIIDRAVEEIMQYETNNTRSFAKSE